VNIKCSIAGLPHRVGSVSMPVIVTDLNVIVAHGKKHTIINAIADATPTHLIICILKVRYEK
jgi:hypothetical protein